MEIARAKEFNIKRQKAKKITNPILGKIGFIIVMNTSLYSLTLFNVEGGGYMAFKRKITHIATLRSKVRAQIFRLFLNV